jgi:hypothetical protein
MAFRFEGQLAEDSPPVVLIFSVCDHSFVGNGAGWSSWRSGFWVGNGRARL